MIDIKLTDKDGKEITKCGVGLSSHQERVTYIALKNALFNPNKLIEIFGTE